MDQFRQGDVFLERVSDDHANISATIVPREGGRIVLAHGEVTGHAHAIKSKRATLQQAANGDRYLVAATGVKLEHEEHGTITLPTGTYRVKRQREYSPEAIRNVAD